jgi:hypothetical protein
MFVALYSIAYAANVLYELFTHVFNRTECCYQLDPRVMNKIKSGE